jgi:hypothetical protein
MNWKTLSASEQQYVKQAYIEKQKDKEEAEETLRRLMDAEEVVLPAE